MTKVIGNLTAVEVYLANCKAVAYESSPTYAKTRAHANTRTR